MGTSVCSYHIRGCTQAECIKALEEVRSPTAYVSVVTDDWLSVVDTDSEAFRLEPVAHRIAKISKLLPADVVMTAVYDDDMCMYIAFHAGAEVDQYSSGLEGFEGIGCRELPGDISRLSKAFVWWHGKDRLEKALKKRYTMESSRLRHIVLALGIPEYRAFTKIRDIKRPLPPERLAQMPPDSEIGMRFHDPLKYVEFKGWDTAQ